MTGNYRQLGEGDYKADLYNNIINAHTKEDFRAVGSKLMSAIKGGVLNMGEIMDYQVAFIRERSKLGESKGN